MTIPLESICYKDIELEIPITLIHPSVLVDIINYDNIYELIFNVSNSILTEFEINKLLSFLPQPSESDLTILNYKSLEDYHLNSVKSLCEGSIQSFEDPLYLFSNHLQAGYFHPYHAKQCESLKLNEWDKYYFKSYKRQVIQDNFLRAIQFSKRFKSLFNYPGSSVGSILIVKSENSKKVKEIKLQKDIKNKYNSVNDSIDAKNTEGINEHHKDKKLKKSKLKKTKNDSHAIVSDIVIEELSPPIANISQVHLQQIQLLHHARFQAQLQQMHAYVAQTHAASTFASPVFTNPDLVPPQESSNSSAYLLQNNAELNQYVKNSMMVQMQMQALVSQNALNPNIQLQHYTLLSQLQISINSSSTNEIYSILQQMATLQSQINASQNN